MSESVVQKYGWTAVPVDLKLLISQSSTTSPAPPFSTSEFPLPSSALTDAVHQYAKNELPIETFNHSLRVFYFGSAILAHAFPSWSTDSFLETYFLTCLLHDLGTTPKNMNATHLSFEFQGGILALSLLKDLHAPIAQAESVTEAIIRHQDLGETGNISRVGALVQLATIFDNMGQNPELVARETIESVVKAYPRQGWSGCFASTVRKENELKPWAHSGHLGIEEFPDGVEGNKLMAEWD